MTGRAESAGVLAEDKNILPSWDRSPCKVNRIIMTQSLEAEHPIGGMANQRKLKPTSKRSDLVLCSRGSGSSIQ
jgi:hypothetical protein